MFVNDETEKKNLDLAERFDTTPEMLARTSNRTKLELLKSPEQTSRLNRLVETATNSSHFKAEKHKILSFLKLQSAFIGKNKIDLNQLFD